MNMNSLKADLTARGYTVQSDPAATAAALNALTITQQGDTTVAQVLAWSAANNLLTTFAALAANAASPLQNAAMALQTAFTGGYATFALTNPTMQSLIAAFVTGNVITAVQQAALMALGQTTVNYAIKTYGRALTASDVSVALAGGPKVWITKNGSAVLVK